MRAKQHHSTHRGANRQDQHQIAGDHRKQESQQQKRHAADLEPSAS
jgi:hypothetical protein